MPATLPALTDTETWPDETLDALRVAVLAEQERRWTIATAPTQAAQLADAWERATGRTDGDPWVQPTGAHDAYKHGARVTHDGHTWESLHSGNAHAPGESGWRIVPDDDPDTGEPGVAPYVQPTGAHDAYRKGDRVLWEGDVWESTMDGNVWTPSDLPSGWVKVTEAAKAAGK